MIAPQLGHRAWGSIAPLVLTPLDRARADLADALASLARAQRRGCTQAVRRAHRCAVLARLAVLRMEAGG